MEIHPSLAWVRAEPTGGAWLSGLPALVQRCAERWSLRIGETYAYPSGASLVLRATRADGTPATLKIVFPYREATHEADALQAWNGDSPCVSSSTTARTGRCCWSRPSPARR